MRLILLVTPDEYELPLAVAESFAELSRQTGIPAATIRAAASRGYMLSEWGCRVVIVEVEDDE